MQISVYYTAKWRLKDKPNYVWTENKRLINLNTGREIKKTLKGLTPGYWIGSKFLTLTNLKNKIELIPKETLPF